MSQDITAIDFFCGAGGSSTGLVNAGLRVVGAANHWKLAIETHNTNHPTTEHYLDDLQSAHPSWYPRTTIAWFSPECTNHSLAKGKKRKGIGQLDLWGESQVDPAEERSRATMREVVEFTEYHRYEIIIVENVVDIRHWQHYDSWLQAMLNLGYDHKVLYLNAQFFNVPQSRDRFYAVFWKRGNRAPNLDFRPMANCPKHDMVYAIQAWKKAKQWGRYGKRRQYIYCCPQCGIEVMPGYRPAADIIDWSLPSEKIGERQKPLKEKTLQRVLAGLKKFGYWSHVADLSHSHAAHNGKVHSTADPLPTETSQQRHALIQPFIASYHGGRDAVQPADMPLPVVTTFNHEHALVTPPYLVVLKNSHSPDGLYTLPPRGLDEPLTTVVASASQHYLVQPPFLTSLNHSDIRNTSTDEPTPTIMPDAHPAMVTPPFLIVQRGTGTQDGIATPVSIDDPMRTITSSQGQHVLINPPVVMSYYGQNPIYAQVTEPLPTLRTVQHEALITPEELLPECGFRMLEPHELKRGMSFDDEYIILGNKRDQVKQIGNAVCPNVAAWIAAQCVESLS